MGTLFVIVAAFIAGSIVSLAVLLVAVRKYKSRKRKNAPAKSKRKIEFSKLILALVLSTYFIGVAVGVKVTFIDISQLGVLLAFIGAPTAAAIGFYAWKAKAENIIKIKKSNPEETEGISVDLNNINA